MEDTFSINIDEYEYDLPENRIAQYPAESRDNSKLLVYNKGIIREEVFNKIPGLIPENSLLVFNNTRVIKARLLFIKGTGAGIEVFCIDPVNPPDYTNSLSSMGHVEWRCIAGNLRKWKNDVLELKCLYNGSTVNLSARKVRLEGDTLIVRFEWDQTGLTFGAILDVAGHVPLPPYIKRSDTPDDNNRYQTVYSKENGSVAAPTAGLHFTGSVLSEIRDRGIKTCSITLHVGAGTFQPVKGDNIAKHEMHIERYYLNINDLITIYKETGNIIPVGTTSVRALESLFWLGLKLRKAGKTGRTELFTDQWEPYTRSAYGICYKDAIGIIIEYLLKRNIVTLEASTRIIIVPGYNFRATEGMITNFHQPRSTLLLLVSAWVGEDWKKIYRYALSHDFRFLSYGDSSMLLR